VNLIEAAKFLTVSSAMTGRVADEDQAEAWSVILDDISLGDALAGLRAHYRASRFPIMPADIVDQVGQLKVATEREEHREAITSKRRSQNAAHRRELLAKSGALRDTDLLWLVVGWNGDDEANDPLATTITSTSIE
jgi:hypothetical protein